MNILHITDRKPEMYSGAEKCVLQLAELAVRDAHDVSILYSKTVREEMDPTIDGGNENGVKMLEIAHTMRGGDFAPPGPDARALNDLFNASLERIAPDVVHIHNISNMPVGALPGAVSSNTRTVLTLHDFSLFCKQRFLVRKSGNYCDSSGDGKNCAKFCTEKQTLERRSFLRRAGSGGPEAAFIENVIRARRMAVKRVNAVTAPSEFVFQVFRKEGFELNNAVVMEPGVGIIRTERKKDTVPPLRFIALGSISIEKGADLLIEAFRDVPPGEAKLVFHGGRVEDNAKTLLDEAVKTCGSIEYAGAYEEGELAGILSGADCLINATRLPETFSMVLSEAWMGGVPVIAADIGAIPGRVDNGENGILFEPGDAGALGRAVRTLIENPAMIDKMSAAAPAVQSIRDYYNETIKLYEAETS